MVYFEWFSIGFSAAIILIFGTAVACAKYAMRNPKFLMRMMRNNRA